MAGFLEEVSSKHRGFRQAEKSRDTVLREEVVREEPSEEGRSGGEQPPLAGSQEAMVEIQGQERGGHLALPVPRS